MALEPIVFIVDDDESLRETLTRLVESVGLSARAFESATSFLEAYEPEQPGCLVLDVRMRGMSGLDLLSNLRAGGSALPVIMMSAFGDVATAVRAMKAGALDFVEKPFSNQAMLELIQQSLKADSQAREARRVKDEFTTRHEALTTREREVMALVVSGASNKEISSRLGISPKTVEAHRARVMRKMDARSLADLGRMGGIVLSPAP